MSTKIIAIANHKGGVGKTTTVASVGAALASRGYRVLLVDLDAQSNLSSSLSLDFALNVTPERTIYEALREGKELPIVEVSKNLSLVPSSLDLAGIELDLSSSMEREYLLKDLLEEVKSSYDCMLLDTPPSLGLLTVNAFVAATDVVIPLTAEALPSKGLQKITDIIARTQRRLNTALSLSGIVITRYEKSKLSQMVEDALRAGYGDLVFNTKIRKNISVAEAPLYSKSILEYAPESNGAKDYADLATEIEQKIVIR